MDKDKLNVRLRKVRASCFLQHPVCIRRIAYSERRHTNECTVAAILGGAFLLPTLSRDPCHPLTQSPTASSPPKINLTRFP